MAAVRLAVNARARIGSGPWYNANGQIIAANVADLHGDLERDRNNIRKPTASTRTATWCSAWVINRTSTTS